MGPVVQHHNELFNRFVLPGLAVVAGAMSRQFQGWVTIGSKKDRGRRYMVHIAGLLRHVEKTFSAEVTEVETLTFPQFHLSGDLNHS